MNRSDCAIACSALRFGRNPLFLLKNFASHIGSKTCRIHCCISLSMMVGIPNGRFFFGSFPLGISTRLTEFGMYHWSFFFTCLIKAVSDHLLKSLIVFLSVPAVLLPLFFLIFR